MQRGDVWAYRPQGMPREQRVVVVSRDGFNQSARPWVLGVALATEDPADILAVPVPGHGWADTGQVTRFYRRWLAEHLTTVDATTAEQLNAALRAALDL